MIDNNYHYGVEELVKRYPSLEVCADDIKKAYKILEYCYENGHKLLIAGNGGSCADSEHIVGELMKGFKKDRHVNEELKKELTKIDPIKGTDLANNLQLGLPAIALDSHQGLNTAVINDISNGGEFAFAQQLNVLGNKEDVFLGISTSGNSKNVFNAAIVAKAKGLKIIALTGETGGKLANIADCVIKVPSRETFMIQEMHLPIYHCLCLMLEEHFFK